MGFIYTWNRVRSHRIPRPEAFREMRDAITAQMRESPAVRIGAVFGSATRDDVGCRSDFDLFLEYDPRKAEEAKHLLRRFSSQLGREHIVLNLRCRESGILWNDEHRFGPSYRGTWKKLLNLGLLVGDPAAYYRSFFLNETVRDEMARELGWHVRRTRVLQLRYERARDNARWLERFLEQTRPQNVRPAHLHIALSRNLLYWKHGRLADDRKRVVVDRVLADQSFNPLHADMRDAREADDRYDAILAEAIAGTIPKHAYDREVRRVLDALMHANLRLAYAAHDLATRRVAGLVAA